MHHLLHTKAPLFILVVLLAGLSGAACGGGGGPIVLGSIDRQEPTAGRPQETVRSGLRIHVILPARAKVGEQAMVVGTGFGDDKDGCLVVVAGRPVVPLQVRPNKIAFRVPAGMESGPLMVAVRQSRSNAVLFEVLKRPRITGLLPEQARPGERVVLVGENFAQVPEHNVVRLGRQRVKVISAGATNLEVVLPEGARTGTISAATEGGTSNGMVLEVTP